MRRLGPVLTLMVALPALVGLTGCSSSDKATPSTTTTAPGSASTSTSAGSGPSTATTASAATSTTAGAVTTTTVKAPVVFTAFTISPPSPVECNAPTMVELKWKAVGVTSVNLSIDGVHAGTFGGGAQDHLQYFACDGKKHNYALTAKVGTTTATVSRDVVSAVVN